MTAHELIRQEVGKYHAVFDRIWTNADEPSVIAEALRKTEAAQQRMWAAITRKTGYVCESTAKNSIR